MFFLAQFKTWDWKHICHAVMLKFLPRGNGPTPQGARSFCSSNNIIEPSDMLAGHTTLDNWGVYFLYSSPDWWHSIWWIENTWKHSTGYSSRSLIRVLIFNISVLLCQAGWESRCVSQLFAAATLGGAFGASGGHWPDRCCDLVWSWPPPGHACWKDGLLWMGAPQVVGFFDHEKMDLLSIFFRRSRRYFQFFFHFPVSPARCCSWVSSVPFCSPLLSPWRWS